MRKIALPINLTAPRSSIVQFTFRGMRAMNLSLNLSEIRWPRISPFNNLEALNPNLEAPRGDR